MLITAFLFVVFLVLILPAIVVRACRPPRSEAMPHTCAEDLEVRLLVDPEGIVLRLPLEEYVKGVVAAEMPATFAREALKAQAVAARTFAVRRLRDRGGAGVPGGADVRTGVEQGGQAWLSREQLLQRWGPFGFNLYWPRIQAVVRATRGLILTHQGLPIDALYHSTCAGRTENSEDVWQEARPYLRSVACPACRHSPHARWNTRTLSLALIAGRLGEDAAAVSAAAAGRPFLETVSTTAGGRAETIRVGDRAWRANDFRLRLGLPSTRFTVELHGEQVRLRTIGWGHAVGMCQYGADGLALQGLDFRAILQHYYTGVDITPLADY
ncbi:MAG TPA: stage II sporulation protein D [Bacillota bacterium]|nr:stage II sporulation protein D [Bacillota bacterium]